MPVFNLKNAKLVKSLAWSRRKRRLGAPLILTQYFQDEPLLLEKKATIDYFQTLSPKKIPLLDHLQSLEHEFEGQPLLYLYHAVLIVLIRRDYKTQEIFQEFDRLWQKYPQELATQLNLRWLASAADTFIDCHPDATVKALMLNVIVLLNTIKIYETEHASKPMIHSNELTSKQPLFDGLETFFLNRDDSLLNMRRRMDQISQSTPHGLILNTVFDRLHSHDNAYSRLKEKHTQKRTQWWKT